MLKNYPVIYRHMKNSKFFFSNIDEGFALPYFKYKCTVDMYLPPNHEPIQLVSIKHLANMLKLMIYNPTVISTTLINESIIQTDSLEESIIYNSKDINIKLGYLNRPSKDILSRPVDSYVVGYEKTFAYTLADLIPIARIYYRPDLNLYLIDGHWVGLGDLAPKLCTDRQSYSTLIGKLEYDVVIETQSGLRYFKKGEIKKWE